MSVAVELTGVPETMLWTLYHRAAEARRPDAVLEDPLAVELAGAARAALRRRDPPLPGGAPGRHRGGARRGARNAVLARRVARLAALSPHIRDVHSLPLPRAPGFAFGVLNPALQRLAPALLHRIFALRFQ